MIFSLEAPLVSLSALSQRFLLTILLCRDGFDLFCYPEVFLTSEVNWLRGWVWSLELGWKEGICWDPSIGGGKLKEFA